MRSFAHSLRLGIAAAVCLAFSWQASAAVDAYMKIEGTKQGGFKGEIQRQGSNQWIPVFTVSYQARSPRDAATGQASGKRQHEPIKITKEWGAASPQLQKALAENEHLKEVVIEFVRSGAPGKEQVYQTITLTDAAITSIQKLHGAGKNGHEGEEITFSYEKIEVTRPQGNKSATDSWVTK